MIQDLQAIKISELDQLQSNDITADTSFVVSNPVRLDENSIESKKLTYSMLSAQLYNDIITRFTDGSDDDSEIGEIKGDVETLSASLDEIIDSILRLANCSKKFRTIDLAAINKRITDLEIAAAKSQKTTP